MNALQKIEITEITRLHLEIEESLRMSLQKAIRVGELLCKAKDELKHGKWIPWIEQNLPFSERTAQRYMALFNRKGELSESTTLSEAYQIIEPTKNDTVSDLEIPDVIMKLGAILEEMNDNEFVTGITHDDRPHQVKWVTIQKINDDKVNYELVIPNPLLVESGVSKWSSEPVDIGIMLLYLCKQPKILLDNITWCRPGLKFFYQMNSMG